MYKHLYSRFLNAHPTRLHFASHSHHYWPDVTREAQIQYWDDSALHVDNKWDYLFSEKVPQAQKLIAENLNLSPPSQIVFAPNTHEFVFRLLSSLDWGKRLRILTTDSEFYSFDRQINRLSELGQFEVVKVPTQPFSTFHERFEAELEKQTDLVFISHVFFNSGWACDIHRLAKKATGTTRFVIDGYHGFMALPTDLSSIQDHVFYLAGSYKYAQGGEGACFLYVPPKTRHRPFYTGWFAEISHLSAVGNEVGYPTDGLQYAGSTMDLSALYRLIATLELFKKEKMSCEVIHAHIMKNQIHFLDLLERKNHPLLNLRSLVNAEKNDRGHFLTFELPDVDTTKSFVSTMAKKGITLDSRSQRLRIGFGLYHDSKNIEDFVSCL